MQVYGSSQRKELGTVALKCAAQGALIYLIILGPYLNLVYLIDILPGDHGLASPGLDEVYNKLNHTLLPRGLGAPADDSDELFQEIAVQYLRITCVCGLLNFLTQMIAKYLAIQDKTLFVYVIAAFNLSIHTLINWWVKSLLYFCSFAKLFS